MSQHSNSILSGSEVSTLNPRAPVFVPSYAHALIHSKEAKQIDDAMACFHHLTTVNDTETLNEAKGWLGEDPDAWFDNGMDYMYPDGTVIDDRTGRFCDYEDTMRDQLYAAPQRPKGDTRGRARPRH